MNFGQYTIIDDARHYLKEEPTWFWDFKPVTAKEELAISTFVRGGQITTSAQGMTRRVKTTEEIAIEELVLTFGGTNISKDGEEGGEPILEANSSPEKIRMVIESFPRKLYMELWNAMAEHVPGWGPATNEEDNPNE